MRNAIHILLIVWWNMFFYCIQQTETGGEIDPSEAVGLAGEIGPMQILPDYWSDAVEYDKSIGGTYEDCKDYSYACRVVHAYMMRYGISKGIIDPVALARIHNKGPKGYQKNSSKEYGRKFNQHWERVTGKTEKH